MKLFAAALALVVALPVEAISINSSVYFAYAEGPGGVITLSRQACSIKKFASAGWKRARFYRGEGDTGIDSCWNNSAKPYLGAVSICKISEEKPGEFLGCAPTAKDEFFETKSLPTGASF